MVPKRLLKAAGIVSANRNALYASMIMTYAQRLPAETSLNTYRYGLNLERWPGSGVAVASFELALEDIRTSSKQPGLVNLLMDPHLSNELMVRQGDLREVVSVAANLACLHRG
jgi:6-phosphogluconate dehydrogenase